MTAGMARWTWRRSFHDSALSDSTDAKSTFGMRPLGMFLGWNVSNVLIWTIPYLVLPAVAGTAEVAFFGAAHRIISLASIILVGLNGHFAPRFARLNREGNAKDTFRMLLISQVCSSVAFLPCFLLFTLLPERILSLYGDDYQQASLLLLVMTWGALVNAMTGLAADFLHMTHHEGTELAITTIAGVIMLIACLFFGQRYGVLGVAAAFSVTMAGRNIVSYIACLWFFHSLRKSVEM